MISYQLCGIRDSDKATTYIYGVSIMIKYTTNLEGIKKKELTGFFVGWRKPLTIEQFHKILQNSEYIVVAYEADEKRVVGFINALSDEVNFAFIPMLEVLPDYQHQGIGTKLVEKMLEELEHINCIDLMCDTDTQSFYKKFGLIKSSGMILRK